jgi:hypothetical protein
MNKIIKLLQKQFSSIQKVVMVCVLSVLISMLVVFNEYYQAKFAVRITIVHLAGIITTSLLLKKYFLLKIKSFFWKVEGVVFVYFMVFFFIMQGFILIEIGRLTRAVRTEFVEMETFFLTLLISTIIAIIMSFGDKNQLVDENKNHTENVNSLWEVQDISIVKKDINPKKPSKNSFLHGADNYGIMEKGVVYENSTYIYEKNDNSEFQPVIKNKK